jgi:hypothetical protein
MMAVASESRSLGSFPVASITPSTLTLATLVPGTLDILSAFLFAGLNGIGPGRVLRFIASGPFGDGMRQGGVGTAAVGLATHFVLMAIMATLFALAAARLPLLRRAWFASGVGYGLILYAVMYWIVVPARFGAGPAPGAWEVANALFSHIVCVGIPMAWIVRRGQMHRGDMR